MISQRFDLFSKGGRRHHLDRETERGEKERGVALTRGGKKGTRAQTGAARWILLSAIADGKVWVEEVEKGGNRQRAVAVREEKCPSLGLGQVRVF
jgi:hypothetical protein